MDMKQKKNYFMLLIEYKCLGRLCFTVFFEIIRGLLLTTGVAWGINWITEGCLNTNARLFGRGIGLFSGSIIMAVILVFLIEWVKKCTIINLNSKLRYECITKSVDGVYEQVKKIDKSEWTYRVSNNVQQVGDLFNAIQLCLGGAGKIFGALLSGILLSWQLTIVLLVYGIIKIFIEKKILKKMYYVQSCVNKEKSAVYSLMLQMLQGMGFYRYLANLKVVNKKFEYELEEYQKITVKVMEIDRIINVVNKGTEVVALLAVLVLGARLAYVGAITMGAFVSFVSIYDTLINPYKFIGRFMREYQRIRNGIDNVLEILNMNITAETKESEECFWDIPYKLCCENIDFSYEKKVLEQVNIEAKSGEITYIVGKSGCGKSTLFNIICGLYGMESGEIYVETKNGKKVKLDSHYVTLVSQNPFLFNGSIKENICMQNEDEIDQKKLEEVLEKAQCREFINALNQGIDHWVEDGGKNFSGGQRSRLALARMLYNPTPILLLDELYASLDNATIAKIENTLRDLLNNNHCILNIMHRDEWIPEGARVYKISN